VLVGVEGGQHDGGGVLVGCCGDLVAVGRLGYHGDAVDAVEHHGQPAADKGVVVDDEYPQRTAHAGQGSRACSQKRPPLRPWSSRPPASCTRSVSPTRPVPLPTTTPPVAGAPLSGPRR